MKHQHEWLSMGNGRFVCHRCPATFPDESRAPPPKEEVAGDFFTGLLLMILITLLCVRLLAWMQSHQGILDTGDDTPVPTIPEF